MPQTRIRCKRFQSRIHVRLAVTALACCLTLPAGAGDKPAAGTSAREEGPSGQTDPFAGADAKQKAVWERMARTPRGLFHSGRYARALAALAGKDDAAALALKAEILVETGRDREAVRMLTAALKRHPNDARLLARRAEAYLVPGAYALAAADYRAASDDMGSSPKPGQMRARLGLGRLYHLLARRDGWLDAADWFFDHYDPGKGEEYGAREIFYLGAGAILGEDYKNGFAVMAMAEKKDPTFLPVLVRMGEVYQEKYEYADARRELDKALRLNPLHPPALVAMAGNDIRRRDFTAAEERARKALATNPRCTDAMLMLATVRFLDEQDREALAWINRALAINPRLPPALIMQATVYQIMDRQREYKDSRKRLLEVYRLLPAPDAERARLFADTGLARLYTEVSGALGVRRSEPVALPWARKAAAADPENAQAQARLGICLMRCGLEREAEPVLARAWELDRFNVWIYNLRKLLRQARKDYTCLRYGRFRIRLHQSEAAILRVYVQRLAEQYLTRCEQVFGYKVPGTVMLSVMRTQPAFAARVTGLPTLHASGATTGPFVALVSPRAFLEMRHPLNWQSTMLHELAHVVTLTGSRFRIPRWLTEGMSVYMQGDARDLRDIPLKTMLARGRFPDLATWNRDFTHPRHPWIVPAAYEAAGLCVRWLVEKHGREVLPRLVALYGQGLSTAEVFRQVTGRNLQELNSWLRARLQEYGRSLQCPVMEDPSRLPALEQAHKRDPRNPETCLRLLRIYNLVAPSRALALAGTVARRALDAAAAGDGVTGGERAITLACVICARDACVRKRPLAAKPFLELAARIDPDNAHVEFLRGVLASARGDTAVAERRLRSAISLYPRFVRERAPGNPYQALLTLLLARGDKRAAARLLEDYLRVRSDDVPALRRLGELYGNLGDDAGAIRCLRRIFAVDPYHAQDHRRLAALLAAAGKKRAAAVEGEVAAACATLRKQGKDAAPDQVNGVGRQEDRGKRDSPPPARVGRPADMDKNLQKFLRGL